MICLVCGKGPAPEHGGVTVYRQNPLGEIGVWACAEHRVDDLDKETQRLVDVLEHRNFKGESPNVTRD